MAGQRDTDAEPRPLTYEAASARYTGTEAAYERFTELRIREVTVLSESPVLSEGSEPLTAAEHLEMMAATEVLARYYQRHQARINRAVRAGASWEQVAAATGISAAQARQEYRNWIRQQHVRSKNPNPHGLGMDDAEYVAALARAVEPDAGPGGRAVTAAASACATWPLAGRRRSMAALPSADEQGALTSALPDQEPMPAVPPGSR